MVWHIYHTGIIFLLWFIQENFTFLLHCNSTQDIRKYLWIRDIVTSIKLKTIFCCIFHIFLHFSIVTAWYYLCLWYRIHSVDISLNDLIKKLAIFAFQWVPFVLYNTSNLYIKPIKFPEHSVLPDLCVVRGGF